MIPPRKADHALRRKIAELASLGSDDIVAILVALDAGERSRVEQLLHDYAGKSSSAPSSARIAHTDFLTAGLSPWLAERLEQSGERSEKSLTTATLAALRDCARELRAPVADKEPLRNSAPSLFGRIASLLVRQGPSA